MMYNMHYWGGNWGIGGAAGFGMPFFPTLILGLTVWSLFWKGLALWHSAQRGQAWWFLALLIINTVGILDIIYLFFFARVKLEHLFSRHQHRA